MRDDQIWEMQDHTLPGNECPRCHNPKRPGHVCNHCGYVGLIIVRDANLLTDDNSPC